MKKILMLSVIVLSFVLGIGLILYPSVSDWWNSRWNDEMISVYKKETDNYSKERLEDEWKRARAYNKQHTVNTVKDAFANDQYIKTHPYSDLLNPSGNGIMGYIKIPKIKERIIIFHGTGDKGLKRGAGHVEGTSLPIGGKGAHAVIAAHRGLPNAKLFSELDKMKNGDLFYITVLKHTLAYKVDRIKVVKPNNANYFEIDYKSDLVTLLTCTPYGVNSHRLLVRGHRVANDGNDKVGSALNIFFDTWQFKLFIAVIVLLAMWIAFRCYIKSNVTKK